MTPNIYRDEYEDVAESIKSRLLRSSAASILVEITDGGNVRMIGCGYMPDRTLAARLHGRRALGVYDKRAATEHIEDDILDWRRRNA